MLLNVGLVIPRRVGAVAAAAAAVFGTAVAVAVVHANAVPQAASAVAKAGLTGFSIRDLLPPPPPSPQSLSASLGQTPAAGTPPRQIIVPDVIAALPTGVDAAQLARIRKLAGVR